MKYIEDKDLNFLKNVKSTDLDNLVKILTNTKTEELTKRDTYKEFYPKHNCYWEEIASELQYFGGNSIANVFRQKGVLYAEILRDVCKELGIKFNTYLSTEEIEEILLAYEKKEGILEEIKRQARNIDPKGVAALIATRLTPLALPSLPILAIKKLSDPAYRVTIEAVSEVATLRKKYTSFSKDISTKNSGEKNLVLKYSDSLVIKDEETNSNIVEIKVIEDDSIEQLSFKQNNTEIGGIKHLISDIAKGVIGTSNQTVELVFSAEVQKGLANGTYKLLENRAWVVSSTSNKIKEHATIVQSGQAKQFLTGGYQLLSIAVAQSHLADIEKRLCNIENFLKQILEKLDAEDKSRIQGATEYIKSILLSIQKNEYKSELSSSQKNQIENINKDILHWKNKLLDEFKTLINEANSIKDKDTFGTENTFKELKKILKERITPLKERYELLINLYLSLTILIKFIDPFEKEFTRINFDLKEFDNKFDELNKIIEKQQSTLKSYFNSDDTLNERKKVLNILQLAHKNDFNNLGINYKDSISRIERNFNRINNEEISVIVSLGENSEVKQYLIKN
ncbi:DUF3944 domain-containing protein [Aliarcobacter butzleri]|uniref:DUF3944 domain-containing protein n=1 Tax=Aliarcobacter butzleri TaxID=28197 RepID=UPI0021B17E0A|nr:DUF3944 domain-containing protein [Aliarcobacter butzleri]MCT7550928.1 DUF3944 domain-containing protein [Aliarcobacter butzleri]MCT7559254.1 DUF3944 domain-containing protein [Aliarcobacter butzleri]